MPTKRVPNVISSCRLFFTVMLLFLTAHPGWFIGNYLLCGCSDAVDGYIARKYHVESEFGAKIDSLADFMLFCMTFVSMIFIMRYEVDLKRLSCVFAVAFLKLVNFVITRIKFKQWNIIHTIGHKVAGLMLFLSVPLFVLAGEFYFNILLVIAIIMAIPAVEELLILLTSKSYDANQKSIFVQKQVS